MGTLTQYVLGFVFSLDYQDIILIKKNKPEWQKGLFNAPGGKIENTDRSIYAAIEREIHEETGVSIPEEKWSHFATLTGPEYRVYCLVSSFENLNAAYSPTTEITGVYKVSDIVSGNLQIVPSLAYLTPLARDYRINPKSAKYTSFNYE